MLLSAILEGRRKSFAIWYMIFRQSPKLSYGTPIHCGQIIARGNACCPRFRQQKPPQEETGGLERLRGSSVGPDRHALDVGRGLR
jgi:hypothetical protein